MGYVWNVTGRILRGSDCHLSYVGIFYIILMKKLNTELELYGKQDFTGVCHVRMDLTRINQVGQKYFIFVVWFKHSKGRMLLNS